jgi:hypothetical protein
MLPFGLSMTNPSRVYTSLVIDLFRSLPVCPRKQPSDLRLNEYASGQVAGSAGRLGEAGPMAVGPLRRLYH